MMDIVDMHIKDMVLTVSNNAFSLTIYQVHHASNFLQLQNPALNSKLCITCNVFLDANWISFVFHMMHEPYLGKHKSYLGSKKMLQA